jgi:hypothetical protein
LLSRFQFIIFVINVFEWKTKFSHGQESMFAIAVITAFSLIGSLICSLMEAALYSIPRSRIETLQRAGGAAWSCSTFFITGHGRKIFYILV